VLSRRRVPALTGEGGFEHSTMADLGRYLGKADVAFKFLGRKVDDLVGAVACGVVGSCGLRSCSSGDDLW